jgi:hypothetical protein
METVQLIQTGSFLRDLRGHELPERHVMCCISTSDFDRLGRKVEQTGINVQEYMRNPVVLWDHMTTLPPIGRTVTIQANGMDGTYAMLEYAPEIASPLAEQLWQLEKAGFLPAQSIGWTSDAKNILVNEKTQQLTFKRCDLLEWSKVTVPANPHAVNSHCAEVRLYEQARAFGLLTYEPLISQFVQKGLLSPRPRIRSLSVSEAASLI